MNLLEKRLRMLGILGIGGIFDWNALFDAFPGDIYVNIYRALLLTFSVGLWLYTERRSKDEIQQNGSKKDFK